MQLTDECDAHRDCMQPEPPRAIFKDVKYKPNPVPNTPRNDEPVVGMFAAAYADNVEEWRWGPLNDDALFTIELREIKMPGPLATKGCTLANMRLSQSHSVAAAAERLCACRTRALESHTPIPAPPTRTNEVAVAAWMSVTLLSTLCEGTNAKDEFKRAAALLSRVTTKLRELPSQGDKLHVNAVSLSHRVPAHELKLARARGLEFEFEKNRPNSCTLVLPLAVN